MFVAGCLVALHEISRLRRIKMVQAERLWGRLQKLSEIGQQESGGVIRLSFSEEERQAKNLVASWMREAGLDVREDAVGNLIGRREGLDREAPVVLVGSHIDSVFDGGNFDGPLGVLAAIESLQVLQEQGLTPRNPIEVIAFTDEEGARFRFGMIGSRGLAGTLTQTQLEAQDGDGISIATAMRRVGLNPEEIHAAARVPESVKAYLELHIEQGKVLENAGLSVGVVSGIAGPLWLRFTVKGEPGHAGTSPMGMRQDALVGASLMIAAIEEEAAKEQRTVGTVGQLSLSPGGVNIIPGIVEFTLDLRDIQENVRDDVEQRILQRARDICSERSLQLDVEVLQRVPPVLCDAEIQTATLQSCARLDLETLSLVSGAGHDGMQLTALCPIGMVFVRSKNGISHNPAEYTSQQDCTNGANVLYQSLCTLAGCN